MRAGTPPRAAREPPPLDTVRRQVASYVEAEEDNPLREKSAGRAARSDTGMSHEQVKAMLLRQHPGLDAAYIDGVIEAFDSDGNGMIDTREFKKLHAVLLAAQPFEEKGPSLHHGLDREEALAMINGMNLDITADYIHGVWDAHDKNGDGHLDDGEFSTLVAELRRSKSAGRAPSKSKTVLAVQTPWWCFAAPSALIGCALLGAGTHGGERFVHQARAHGILRDHLVRFRCIACYRPVRGPLRRRGGNAGSCTTASECSSGHRWRNDPIRICVCGRHPQWTDHGIRWCGHNH